MTDREKLVKCLKAVDQDTSNIVCEEGEEWGIIADHLIAKGVTIQKRGEWRLNKDGSGTCSECHRTQSAVWDYDTWQRYCGCCGAKMDGEPK